MKTVNFEVCDSCGKCVEPCPSNLLEMAGNKLAVASHSAADCNDCTACIDACPLNAMS